jgi:hypothetical protein
MFKLGETYLDASGVSVRIICVDAAIGNLNVVGIATINNGTKHLRQYNEAGHYCGIGNNPTYNPHHLISDEPNEEEVQLIKNIIGTVQEFGDRDANTEGSLLKIIRQLRKQS